MEILLDFYNLCTVLCGKLQARLTWRWLRPRGIHSRGSVARGFAGAVSECYAWKQRGWKEKGEDKGARRVGDSKKV